MVTPAAEQAVDALKPYLLWGPPTDEFPLFTRPLSFVPTGGDPFRPHQAVSTCYCAAAIT